MGQNLMHNCMQYYITIQTKTKHKNKTGNQTRNKQKQIK